MKVLDGIVVPNGLAGHLKPQLGYVVYPSVHGGVLLDGNFTPDQLEAIAAYMRAHPEPPRGDDE